MENRTQSVLVATISNGKGNIGGQSAQLRNQKSAAVHREQGACCACAFRFGTGSCTHDHGLFGSRIHVKQTEVALDGLAALVGLAEDGKKLVSCIFSGLRPSKSQQARLAKLMLPSMSDTTSGDFKESNKASKPCNRRSEFQRE